MAKIAYLRVSALDQNLARQEALAKEIGADKVFAEKASGRNADRPELKRMLEYAREGDVLHVESISRLARSTRDLLAIVDVLREKGVEFVSHKESIDTSTPTGRFTLTVFAALAEMERESIAIRREEGMVAARKAGTKFGRPALVVPDNWNRIVEDFQNCKITASEAVKQANMSKSSFYRLLRNAG